MIRLEKNLTNSINYFEKSKKLIPSLTQTFSRAAYTFVEGSFPVYAKNADGSHFTDVDGNEYVDYLCGLGPIILGHKYKRVDDAIKKSIELLKRKDFQKYNIIDLRVEGKIIVE